MIARRTRRTLKSAVERVTGNAASQRPPLVRFCAGLVVSLAFSLAVAAESAISIGSVLDIDVRLKGSISPE
jgi:hypothetical protein